MQTKLENRATALANYIIVNKATIRQAAQAFGVSKSTVHSDVSYKLKDINFILFLKTKGVLFNNFHTKHLRAKNQLVLKGKNKLKTN